VNASADHWLGLEVRHLTALRAIAEHGSFGAAAHALGYSQSAVSQQIAALERIVGAPLFDRPGGRRAVALTEAGRLLMRHADALLARVGAARADFAALTRGQLGPLRVGTYQSIGTRVLPAVIQEMAERMPGVEVELHEAVGDEAAWRLLERGRADVAFTMLPLSHELLEAVEVLRDPYVLLVPAGSELAERATAPPLDEVARMRLVALRSCRNEHRIEAQLRARGLEPRIVLRSDDNGTIQGLVASGFGVALMPRLTVEARDPGVVALPFDEQVPPRVLGLAWHRDRRLTPTQAEFVELARERAPVVAAAHAADVSARRPAPQRAA
jgi:molybdate transport repressor ModE-like protein